MTDELRTRHVPWDPIEQTHARNRPHHERPALPKPGDQVWYRHAEWERHPSTGHPIPPELCTVVAVQPLDDKTDPNLWLPLRTSTGMYVADESGQVFQPVPDPWPELDLRRPDRRKADGSLMGYGAMVRTRESRMRGSAGWLPLDYRTRPERWRLPADTAKVQRPPLVSSTEYLASLDRPGGS